MPLAILAIGLIAGLGLIAAGNVSAQTFTTLHSFTNYPTDGATPNARLVVSGKMLYGTAASGGTANRGALFAINTDGTGFTYLHNFTPFAPDNSNSDGATPSAGLILSGNTLYRTAFYGGTSGNGTVFSISLPPPQLTITPSAAYVILTWPAEAAGFHLQSTTNLVSPVAWSAVFSEAVVVNGENTVINLSSATQHFYRLSQQTWRCRSNFECPPCTVCVGGNCTRNGPCRGY